MKSSELYGGKEVHNPRVSFPFAFGVLLDAMSCIQRQYL